MGKKYLLPKLKDDIKIESESCWEEKSNAYKFLIDMLEDDTVSTESIFDEDSSSYPHVFEHMLLFEEAFFDDKHGEHDRAIAEWCSVFAIMALKRMKNINLNIVKVDLTDNSKNPFIKAATMFKPHEKKVIYDTTWDFIYILLLDAEPIALFSPNTIVCPAKLFKNKIKQLKWLSFEKKDDKYTYDFDDDSIIYTCINTWLNKLKAGMARNNIDEVISKYEKLDRYISEYIDDISRKASTGTDVLLTDKVYHNINNERRTEYKFMNFCCDFSVPKRLMYLKDIYTDDIFLPKLLLIACDDKPESLYDNKSRRHLEKIINNTKEIDNIKIINVLSASETTLPFFALIPFKPDFVNELSNKGIMTDELFDMYKTIYKEEQGLIEIQMKIKGFPYLFRQEYDFKECCQFIYLKDLAPISLWPSGKVEVQEWRCYYTYIYNKGTNLSINIPGSETESTTYYPYSAGSEFEKENFKIIRSSKFPVFIGLAYKEASGYLPLKTEAVITKTHDADARMFFDIGHTTSSVSIMKIEKNKSGAKPQKIKFSTLESLEVIVTEDRSFTTYCNFIQPKMENSDTSEDCYFKNMMHSFYSYKKEQAVYSVEPIMDGQALFVRSLPVDIMRSFPLTYINFEYSSFNVCMRKLAHIFIEQLILSAVYKAMVEGCAYFEILFLHDYNMSNNAGYGELKGLWEDAFNSVKKKTGLTKIFAKSVTGFRKNDALAYRLYYNLYRENRIKPVFSNSEACFGIDIGWDKTAVSYITQKNDEERIMTVSSVIRYGGRDLSIIDNEKISNYQNILSVLLGGSYFFDGYNSTKNEMLINELIKMHESTMKNGDMNQYYGMFDIIAMEIENNGFYYSPDAYNKKSEYKYFIDILTYNYMLLFMGIGCMLGKMKAYEYEDRINKENKNNKEIKIEDIYNEVKSLSITIYLGGNGSKLLKWVTNIKDFVQIDSKNAHELFITDMNVTVIDMIKKGFAISFENSILGYMSSISGFSNLGETAAGKTDDSQHSIITRIGDASISACGMPDNDKSDNARIVNDFSCSIKLDDKPKNQLNEGHIFKELPEYFGYSDNIPDFDFINSDDILSPYETSRIHNIINAIRDDLFKGVDGIDKQHGSNTFNDNNISMTSLINANSLDVQDKVLSHVNKM